MKKTVVIFLAVAFLLTGCVEKVEEAAENRAPVALISSPKDGSLFYINDSIIFSANGSFDPEGEDVVFTWDFGDGNEGHGKVVKHAYNTTGEYIIVLYATDGKKNSTYSTSVKIIEKNSVPVAVISCPEMGYVGNVIIFSAENSTDPDGDELYYLWDFGDGTVGSGIKYKHIYANDGNYTVRLIVSDGRLSSVATDNISISPKKTSWSISIRANTYQNIVGEDIEFSTSSYGIDMEYINISWNFGDGATAYGQNVTHIYNKSGDYEVICTGEYMGDKQSSSLKISILPTANIYIKWNTTLGAYIVSFTSNINKEYLRVYVHDLTENITDAEPKIERINDSTFKVIPFIYPKVGHVIEIEVYYKWLKVGNRTIEIFREITYPSNKSVKKYHISMNDSTESNDGTQTSMISMKGTMILNSDGEKAIRTIEINSGKFMIKSTTIGYAAEMCVTIVSGYERSVIEYGVDVESKGVMNFSAIHRIIMGDIKIVELMSNGTTETENDSKINEYIMGEGTYLGEKMTVTTKTIGRCLHANGDGKIFPCIINLVNTTLHFTYQKQDVKISYIIINETKVWKVAYEDMYDNEEIYKEYVERSYYISDGKMILFHEKRGKMYLDSNGDGKYNPDPKEKNVLDLISLVVVPRLLLPGDETSFKDNNTKITFKAENLGEYKTSERVYKCVYTSIYIEYNDEKVGGGRYIQSYEVGSEGLMLYVDVWYEINLNDSTRKCDAYFIL